MIIADSGPLIALARLQMLEVLSELFKEIWLPEQVYNECTLNKQLPAALIIEDAVIKGILELKQVLELHPAFADPYLGEGERAAMSLAVINNSAILLDDRRARIVASRQQLPIIGTAGILLAAKQNKLIKKILPFLKQLESFEYYFSPQLKKELLERSNENLP